MKRESFATSRLGYRGDISIGNRGNYVLFATSWRNQFKWAFLGVGDEPRGGNSIEALGRADWSGCCRLRGDVCDNSLLSVQRDLAHRVEC